MTIISTSSDHTLAAQLATSQINQNDAVYVTENKKNHLNGTVLYQSGSFVIGRVEDRARHAQTLDQNSGTTTQNSTHQNHLADDIGKNRETLQKLGEQRLAHTMPESLRDHLGLNGITTLVRNTLDGLERKDLLFANQLNGDGLQSFFESIDSLNDHNLSFEKDHPAYYADLKFDQPASTHLMPDQSDLDQGRTRHSNDDTEPPLSDIAGFISQDRISGENTIKYFDSRDDVTLTAQKPREETVQKDALSQLVEHLKILKP